MAFAIHGVVCEALAIGAELHCAVSVPHAPKPRPAHAVEHDPVLDLAAAVATHLDVGESAPVRAEDGLDRR